MLTLHEPVLSAARQVLGAPAADSALPDFPLTITGWMNDHPTLSLAYLASAYSRITHPGLRMLVPVLAALTTRKLEVLPADFSSFVQVLLADQLAVYQQRDLSGDGLPCLFSATESLLPCAPYWESMEPVRGQLQVQEPLFLALLAWANESLLALMQLANLHSDALIERQELTIYSMNDLLWDAEYGIYLARDASCGDTILSGSLAGVLPLLAEIADQDQAEAMRGILQANFLEATHYYFPTSSIFNYGMRPAQIDGGAVDPLMNWLLFYGLLRYDFDDLAIHLRRNMLELIGEYGFYRYYQSERSAVGNLGLGAGSNRVAGALFIDLIECPLQHPLAI